MEYAIFLFVKMVKRVWHSPSQFPVPTPLVEFTNLSRIHCKIDASKTPMTVTLEKHMPFSMLSFL